MEIPIGILQISMSLLFVFVGINKIFLSKQRLLEKGMKRLQNHDPKLIKVAGILETLAALGLILPQWLGIWPVLTGVSAIFLAWGMLLAGVANYQLKKSPVINILVFWVCIAIAWFRLV